MNIVSNHADAEIIAKLSSDDENAMVMLYKSHWKELYISAFKILKDKEICEDIIQELFINIWNNRTQLNINTSLRAYLSASVRYEVYRRIKTMKQFEPIIGDAAEIASDILSSRRAEYKELELQIAQTINCLPEKCREVFLLSRYEHLSHKEISAKLSISTNTVRNHLARALQQLRLSVDRTLIVILYIILFLF